MPSKFAIENTIPEKCQVDFRGCLCYIESNRSNVAGGECYKKDVTTHFLGGSPNGSLKSENLYELPGCAGL